MPDSDDSGLGNLIDQAFKLKFKNSAKGVADVGRKHFSQAVQILAICRAVDLSWEAEDSRKVSTFYMSITSN